MRVRQLLHSWADPLSRKVRIVLGEKKLACELVLEKPWERRPEFLQMNPAGEVPVLIEPDGRALSGATAIAEYLDETVPDPPLMGEDARVRAEVRRLVNWFDDKFYYEVTVNLVGEKLYKRIMGVGFQPDSRAIREGYRALPPHLDYVSALIEHRRWLAGNEFSLADISAAAHLSAIDYLGDVPWDSHPHVRDWYARVKSRPSLRPLLADHVPGIPPVPHYADLDF